MSINNYDNDAAWQDFERVSQTSLNTGHKALIPIIGSGFNIKACPESYDWLSLLKDVANEVNLKNEYLSFSKSIPLLSMTTIWEWFVVEITKIKRQDNSRFNAYKAETLLKKIVQKKLKNFENNNKNRIFYKTFLNYNFKDIISLNFDRTLALQYTDGNIVIKHSKNKAFRSNSSLFRHAVVKNGNNTRIWFAHGDTQAYKTIKLGIRSYGIYIHSLKTAFEKYRSKKSNTYKNDHRSWCEQVRNFSESELNWLWLGLSSPLVFIGCSVSRDEWPLWWFLTQRERHLAHYKERDNYPAFIFWKYDINDPQSIWLTNSPARIRPIFCSSWQEGWIRLIDCLNL